jgi:hypothetical protein
MVGLELYAANIDTSPRQLTVEFGGANPGDIIPATIEAQTIQLIIGMFPLAPGLTVRAYSDVANKINVYGWQITADDPWEWPDVATGQTHLTLSGTNGGRGIGVTTTAAPGDLIHTARDDNRVLLFPCNIDPSADHTITFLNGGTTPADSVVVNVPSNQGPGLVILRCGTGASIRAYADAPNVVNVCGIVKPCDAE